MAILLDDSAPRAERIKAAQSMGTSTDPLAVDTLARLLSTMDEELRAAAVNSLKVLKAGPVFEARVVDREVPVQKRKEAALVLRHLKAPSSVGPLAAALKDASADVRKEAALALSMIEPGAAEAELIAALADPDKDVRYYAADALSLVKTLKAKDAVKARIAVETNPTVQFSLTTAKDKQDR